MLLSDRLATLPRAYKNAGEELEQKKSALIGSDDEPKLTDEQILELQNIDKEQSTQITATVKKFYDKDKESVLGTIELMLL